MPRKESGGDWQEALAVAMEGKQAELWTALPAILETYDATKRTCEVQPTIKAQVCDELGNVKWVKLPLLLDCPVQFPGGGGFVLTFPLKKGDEGLVVFAARCIDAWWQNGGTEPHVQAELRMHDLSDGFFIPTVRSVPNVEAGISTSDVTLRAVDPSGPMVTLKAGGQVEVKSPAQVTVEAPVINLSGTLYINGEAYDAHRHVSSGAPGYTGPKGPAA